MASVDGTDAVASAGKATDFDAAGMVTMGIELMLPGASKEGNFAPTILVDCTVVLGGFLEVAA